MCGIAGLLTATPTADLGLLGHRLIRALRHRGPDDHGWLLFDSEKTRAGSGQPDERPAQVALLHRRLSILDLTQAGHQPMSSAHGRYHLVFNGEIYNFLELRAELEKLGHAFHTRSDTEVLLHALAAWGVAALPRLIGMFALALLDTQRRTLLLARDAFGIKPLYYAPRPGGLAFASEIKALLELPGLHRQVHPQRLYDYLCLGRTDHGAHTLLEEILQIPAAHFLEVHLDRPALAEPRPYWTIDLDRPLELSREEAAARLRALFLDNVRLHLRSDVPVGAALSGGIDSSAIVAAMRHLAPNLELHAFSYVADDPRISEERWIRLAAQRSGAILHEVRATWGELADDLDALVHCQDEPFGSTSIYAQHRVFRQARAAGVKVMLDGQGADEMLAGYRWYIGARLATLVRQGHWGRAARFLNKAGRLPGSGGRLPLLLQAAGLLVSPKLKALARQWLHKKTAPPWLAVAWFQRRQVLQRDGYRSSEPNILHDQLRRTLQETSLPMLLRYEDRNSMAHSIESRVPFLTPALVDFLLRLPEDYLLAPDGTSKSIFRQAMRGLAPDEILDRKDKIGFQTPERDWIVHLRPWVEKTLQGETARTLPVFRHAEVLKEWQRILDGRRPFDGQVWRWLNLVRWMERFDIRCAA